MQMTRHNDRKDFSEISTEVPGSLCRGMHIYINISLICAQWFVWDCSDFSNGNVSGEQVTLQGFAGAKR